MHLEFATTYYLKSTKILYQYQQKYHEVTTTKSISKLGKRLE